MNKSRLRSLSGEIRVTRNALRHSECEKYIFFVIYVHEKQKREWNKIDAKRDATDNSISVIIIVASHSWLWVHIYRISEWIRQLDFVMSQIVTLCVQTYATASIRLTASSTAPLTLLWWAREKGWKQGHRLIKVDVSVLSIQHRVLVLCVHAKERLHEK